MNTLGIISADERLTEVHAPKILIVGEPGIGKTSLLRTCDAASTLFIDLEAGSLAVQDVPVDTLRPATWPDMRNLACFLGGPDISLPDTEPYSQKHYDAMVERLGAPKQLDKYRLLFVDSLTAASRLCFRWCVQQPEAFSEKKGTRDLLGAYGLLGREMIAWITRLQHIRDWGVVFVAILENVKDEYGRASWQPQLEGGKTARELPGIVDQVIAMAMIDHPEDKEKGRVRAFLCTPEGSAALPGFMAKDRSGRLDAFERPDLGALLRKLTARSSGGVEKVEEAA